MNNCAIVGINWGDEGKGRMVDLLTSEYDVVVRYQGGGNAGHTVINEKGKFALHLLPSGIFHDGVVNILGNGVALDPENLLKEIREVSAKGVSITSAASSSSIADKRAVKLQKKQRTAAWAVFVKDLGILRTRAPGEVRLLEIVCEFMNFFLKEEEK